MDCQVGKNELFSHSNYSSLMKDPRKSPLLRRFEMQYDIMFGDCVHKQKILTKMNFKKVLYSFEIKSTIHFDNDSS